MLIWVAFVPWLAALDDDRIGPVVQFKTGRKDLLLGVLDVCAERDDWEKAYGAASAR